MASNVHHPIIAPYGTWESKISIESVTSSNVSLLGVRVCPRSGRTFLAEGRPDGRNAIVEIFADGKDREILPEPYSARSTVYEYGGGAWVVASNGSIVFSNASDNGVYSLNVDTGEISCLVKQVDRRYADFDPHPLMDRWILAIEEDHRTSSIRNSLVLIDVLEKSVREVVSGKDFYWGPRFAPNGASFCWLEWDHPEMPWTGGELMWSEWSSDLSSICPKFLVGGKGRPASEPRWSQDGTLYFLQEQSNFRQLYRLEDPKRGKAELLNSPYLKDCEFGRAGAGLNSTTFIFMSPISMVAIVTKFGALSTFVLNLETEECTPLSLQVQSLGLEGFCRISATSFTVLGSTQTAPSALYQIGYDGLAKKLRTGVKQYFPADLFSTAKSIVAGGKNGPVHGFYLPPHNPRYRGPAQSKPPLIVVSHGGPTSHFTPGLSLDFQILTSRGYAVYLLNYHGSSGHGQQYRLALDSKWGVLDTQDAITAIQHLCTEGLADETRIGITGGSAGGYCVLQAIATYPEVFAGAVSEYGISDLKLLIASTHKFESHYADGLLFKVDSTEEEKEAVLLDRSPINHADRITSPLLLLQGEEDHVVPKDQAEKMEREIISKGGDVKLILFPGEGHGFRKAETLKVANEEKLKWWRRTLVRDI